jgi:hypothetical protein
LERPQHVSFGAIADRYLDVNFTGRRTVSLVETESARWNDYTWNDGKSHYNVYRETVDFRHIQNVTVWFQNLPPGRATGCTLGQVKALPMLPGVVKNPEVTLNGAVLVLPVEIPSGYYLEHSGEGECTLYGSKGEVVRKIVLTTPWPVLREGVNELQFKCDAGPGAAPRARFVITAHGRPI